VTRKLSALCAFLEIPGIKTESSGGEGNANFNVRGVPVSSGGSDTYNCEDGLPVMLFGGTSFGNLLTTGYVCLT
jgi:hypothetical protein